MVIPPNKLESHSATPRLFHKYLLISVNNPGAE